MDFNDQINSETQMPPQGPKNKKRGKIIILLIIVIVSFVAGYKTGIKGYVFEPKEFKVVNQSSLPQTVDYQLLWDAIKVVRDKYIEKPPTPLEFLYGAIRGAVAAAGDPYTAFFEPKDLETFKTDLKGSFEGIGAEVGKKDGNIVIVAPLPDTPAKRAGLLAQDIISQVNGESTADWTVEQAVNKIRGPKGTTVTLTIIRQGKNAPFDVKIIRQNIEIKSVSWEYKEVDNGGKKAQVAVVTISKFGDDTRTLFDQAVNDILNHSIAGIIIDLRNNPGGYLQTSVDLASNWISHGTMVVTEERSQGEPIKYVAQGLNRLVDIKTEILINGGSASAAEIFAGALHDYKIATLIGEKSFGKGSVQELVDLKDGSAVKVTVAKWITPHGKNLNKDGLDPDISVKLTEDDVKAGKDPQMDKALEEVTK
jgi:carboxyl-terminal processing protease